MNNSRPRLSYLGRRKIVQAFMLVLISLLSASALFAQAGSPWENAANLLQTSFTGPLARALSLIAIVIGGLMFAFSEGGSKKVFAGIVFGLGMALGAVNFMSWLFGVA
jgi:type IV secretory pathway VirB2 component (pilin)